MTEFEQGQLVHMVRCDEGKVRKKFINSVGRVGKIDSAGWAHIHLADGTSFLGNPEWFDEYEDIRPDFINQLTRRTRKEVKADIDRGHEALRTMFPDREQRRAVLDLVYRLSIAITEMSLYEAEDDN